MQNEHLKITGMSCGACVSSVRQALEAVNGVDEVIVSLDAGEATVRYDEHLTSKAIMESAVIAAGYGVTERANPSKGGCCG